MYNSITMHQLTDEVYNRGIPIKLVNPHAYSKPEQVAKLEALLDKYTAELGEPAVLAEWGQPFGGPTIGFQIQKQSDADKLLRAYKDANTAGIYPMLGMYVDKQWCAEKTKQIKEKKSANQFDLNDFFKTNLVFGP